MNGFAAYERNTGTKHPLAKNIKREPGASSLPLVYDGDDGWYGNIDIGTPGQNFIGMAFLASSPSRSLTLALIQWSSILAAAISSYP